MAKQNRLKTTKAKVLRRIINLSLASLIGVFLSFGGEQVKHHGVFAWLKPEPALAQFVRPENVAPQVYQRLPNFPRENQYIDQETGEVDEDNTLIARLVRYHLYVKKRPPNLRFDWKLTLADYLGANERIEKSQYPSHSSLTENPLEGDRAIIESLDRDQRNQLVQVLVSIFNPNAANTSTSSPTPTPSPGATQQPAAPTPIPRRNTPSLPKPGDAELLMP